MSVSISFTFLPGGATQQIVYNGHAGLGANLFDASKNEVSIESLAGSQFLPEVDDEVLVAFGHGDLRRPYLIASLWSSADEPPETSR